MVKAACFTKGATVTAKEYENWLRAFYDICPEIAENIAKTAENKPIQPIGLEHKPRLMDIVASFKRLS